MRKVGILGASGYIGSVVLRKLQVRGWCVVSLGRSAVSGASEHRPVDIGQPLQESAIDGLDAIIHLAANTDSGNDSHAAEIAFATALAEVASRRSIPLLFVSSQAASASAPSQYGRTKAAIERKILPLGAIAIRPGLVYGGQESGLFGVLASFMRRTKLRPCLLPSPLVQAVHVDDVCEAIANALFLPRAKGRWFAVAGPPMQFNVFLKTIASYRVRATTIPVPVPVAVLRLVLLIVGKLFGPKIGAERLKSLTSLKAMECDSDLEELGICLRDLRDGLSRSGRPSRRLLREGAAMRRSLVGGYDGIWSVRNYPRMLMSQDQALALNLPAMLLRFPRLLSALDSPKSRSEVRAATLMGRMNMMYRLCETSTEDAAKFIASGRPSFARSTVALLMVGLSEACSCVLRPIASIIAKAGK